MAITNYIRNVLTYLSATRNKPDSISTRTGSAGNWSVPIYIINLERNKERRTFALQKLDSLGLDGEIFPAVDGKTLNRAELEETKVYSDSLSHEKFSRSLTAGEIGCTLSHLRLYQKMIDENISTAIILEDDAMLVDGAKEKLRELIEKLPDDWDLVQLIYECTDYEIVVPGVVRFLSKRCMPVASAGYLLRKSGAQKMLQAGYPICYPADSFIGRSPRWGTNVYGAKSKLVAINNIFPSDIYHGNSLKSKFGNRLKASLVKLLG